MLRGLAVSPSLLTPPFDSHLVAPHPPKRLLKATIENAFSGKARRLAARTVTTRSMTALSQRAPGVVLATQATLAAAVLAAVTGVTVFAVAIIRQGISTGSHAADSAAKNAAERRKSLPSEQ